MGSVTLMGHSTGAACVNLLMLSPVARGKWIRLVGRSPAVNRHCFMFLVFMCLSVRRTFPSCNFDEWLSIVRLGHITSSVAGDDASIETVELSVAR